MLKKIWRKFCRGARRTWYGFIISHPVMCRLARLQAYRMDGKRVEIIFATYPPNPTGNFVLVHIENEDPYIRRIVFTPLNVSLTGPVRLKYHSRPEKNRLLFVVDLII